MNWYHLLKNISIWGGICSIFITIVGFALLLSVLKSDKYAGKLVRETPLVKYVVFLSTGVILTIVFQIIIFILKLFERT